MIALPETCKDCGAPVGDDLNPLDDCWYWGQMRERFLREGKPDAYYADWRKQGWDPPCGGNSYNRWYDRRARRQAATWISIFAVFVLVLIGIGFLRY